MEVEHHILHLYIFQLDAQHDKEQNELEDKQLRFRANELALHYHFQSRSNFYRCTARRPKCRKEIQRARNNESITDCLSDLSTLLLAST